MPPQSPSVPSAELNFGIITSGRYDPSLVALPEQNGSSIYLLEYHLDRLIDAAEALRFHDASNFLGNEAQDDSVIQTWLERHFEGEYGTRTPEMTLKFRILLPPSPSSTTSTPQDSKGIQSQFKPEITSSPVASLPIASFFPTTFSNPDTLPADLKRWRLFCLPHPVLLSAYPAATHKTTARSVYDAARAELAALLEYTDLPIDVEVLLPVLSPDGGAEEEISEATRSTPYFFRAGTWVTPREAAGGCRGVARRWALTQKLAREGCVRVNEVRVGERVWLSNAVRGFGWGVVEAWPSPNGERGDKG